MNVVTTWCRWNSVFVFFPNFNQTSSFGLEHTFISAVFRSSWGTEVSRLWLPECHTLHLLNKQKLKISNINQRSGITKQSQSIVYLYHIHFVPQTEAGTSNTYEFITENKFRANGKEVQLTSVAQAAREILNAVIHDEGTWKKTCLNRLNSESHRELPVGKTPMSPELQEFIRSKPYFRSDCEFRL